MKEIALLFGLLLTGLGLYSYFGAPEATNDDGTEQRQVDGEEQDANDKGEAGAKKKTSPTALIPALFGLPLMICGTLAYLENLRKHMMHAAAAIALLGGVLAGGRGMMKIGSLFAEETDATGKRAVLTVLIMAVICLVYVALSVRSFMAAKRARLAAESDATLDS